MKKLTLLLLLLALLLPSCATPGASQPGTTKPQTLPQTGGETAEGAYDFFQYEQALDYIERYQEEYQQTLKEQLQAQKEHFHAYLSTPSLLGEPLSGKYDFSEEKKLFTQALTFWNPWEAKEAVRDYFGKLEALIAAHPETEFVFPDESRVGKQGECFFYVDGGYYFTTLEDSLFLAMYADRDASTVTLPAELNGKKVLLPPRSFAGNAVLKEIVLAEGFTRAQISDLAFKDCPNLEKVYALGEPVQETVEGSPAYYGSIGFDKIYGDQARNEAAQNPLAWQEAEYNRKLESHKEHLPQNLVDARPENYVIENGVLTKYLGFGGHLIIPEGVTEIATGVFDYCGADNVLAVTLPSTLKRIQSHVFTECQNLLELTFPEGFEELCEEAIYTKLTILPGEDHADDGHTYGNWVRLNDLPATCTVYGEEFAFWPWQIAHVENVK